MLNQLLCWTFNVCPSDVKAQISKKKARISGEYSLSLHRYMHLENHCKHFYCHYMPQTKPKLYSCCS